MGRVPTRCDCVEGRGGAVAPLYGELAPFYDRLIGDALFPAIRTSFESCRRMYDLRFSAAADVGCGSGRFLRHLSRYRIPLFGVDASAQMLRIAASRLGPDRAHLLCQDIRRFHLPISVDLITCNGDTINYLLSIRDLHHTLSCCREQLRPGGYLLGDFLSGRPVSPLGETGEQVIRLPGAVTKWQWRAYPSQRITEVGIQFAFDTPCGRRISRENHRQRWYTEQEFLRQLNAAGLSDCRFWPMPDRGSAGPGGRWLKFIARRLPVSRPTPQGKNGKNALDPGNSLHTITETAVVKLGRMDQRFRGGIDDQVHDSRRSLSSLTGGVPGGGARRRNPG